MRWPGNLQLRGDHRLALTAPLSTGRVSLALARQAWRLQVRLADIGLCRVATAVALLILAVAVIIGGAARRTLASYVMGHLPWSCMVLSPY
jgi:hypothetical protein